MNITHYEVDKDLDEVLERVLDFPELEDVKEHIKVAVCFKIVEKQGKGEDPTFEPVPPKSGTGISMKKIPPEMQVLMKSDPAAVIIIDKYSWEEWDMTQKEQALHNYLIKLEVKPKNEGGFTASIKPWDIQCNLLNVKRYGVENDSKMMMLDETLATLRNKLTDMAGAAVTQQEAKVTPKAPAKAAAAKSAPKAAPKSRVEMPSDEEPLPGESAEDPNDPPRVRAATLPLKSKTSPLKANKHEEKERTAPARKPPPSEPAEDDTPPDPAD